MIVKVFLVLFIFCFPRVTFGQPGSALDKTALRNIEKHRWQKAEITLRKSLSKTYQNPSGRYGLSVFFFHPDNPAYNLDSAYYYAVTALQDYVQAPARTRDKLRRLAVDSTTLVALRARIDSAAFEVAMRVNTESAYLEFLSHFPSSIQRELAEHLRDEVAFQEALKKNTPDSFRRYLTSYPKSQRARDAQALYDRLLFQEATKDQRLSSYEKFLMEHPETPYKNEIHRNIFELSTIAGTVESFLSFLSKYPSGDFARRSRQIIFHMLAEEERPEWPPGFLSDSLRNLLALNQSVLVPFLSNDRYGFMDLTGREVMPPVYEDIHEQYLCGQVTDDIFIADQQLIARNGLAVFRENVQDVTDMGAGFLIVRSADKLSVIHKGGFMVLDSVQDAHILNKRFIAIRKNDSWFLYSLAGRRLDQRAWDAINSMQNLVVFTKNAKKSVIPLSQITGEGADMLILSDSFDDLKLWPNGLIWGKSGAFEGVMDQSLQGVIRFDQHVLTHTFFGAAAQVRNGFALYDEAGRKSATFEKIKIIGKRVGVKKEGSWFLFDPMTQDIQSRAYDSLGVEGPFFIGIRADTVTVHFSNDLWKTFHQPRRLTFIPGMDSIAFLALQESNSQQIVYDLKGTRLFSANCDEITYAGNDIFVITSRGRKGLLNRHGRRLLPLEFDAIGTVKQEVISVLRNKKFGAYNTRNAKFIKPAYDRNIVPYSERIVITSRGGLYGFIGWDNKPISAFEFDEISHWNDSVALVKRGSTWSLYDVASGTVLETDLRISELVRDTSAEKIAIVQKGKEFGVISNRGQTTIPIAFTAIVNLGTIDSPLYFTEKHIPEASLYVVIYYDGEGNMLRKQIYDNAAHYDKIYCSHQ